MAAAAGAEEGLAQINLDDDNDEEELDKRGAITFKPPTEQLPRTKRTEEIQKKKMEELLKKKQEKENIRKQRENEEAERRKKVKKQNAEKAAQKKKEEEAERRKQEEEEMTKKLQGGLEQLLDVLRRNVSQPHITVCGMTLGGAQLRLLMRALETQKQDSCKSIDLSRKGLNDEDGQELAKMLVKNKGLQKLECEGNNLGVHTAHEFGVALEKNQTLLSLNLESNNLTASGHDQSGVIDLAKALAVNKTLRVLMLSKNGINQQAGEQLVQSIEKNESLTLVDLSGNDPTLSVDQLRRIDRAVQRNRAQQSEIRRATRRERFALYNEEFKCRQYDMQVEAMRLEIEAHEERRLNRMKARFARWVEEIAEKAEEDAQKEEELMIEASDRAEGMKNKGKKKKKSKGK